VTEILEERSIPRPEPATAPAPVPAKPRRQRSTSLLAHGTPYVWFTGGALVFALLMIAGLLSLVLWQGARTFWPGELVRIETAAGRVHLGEVSGHERFVPEESTLAFLSEEDRALYEGLVEQEGSIGRTLLRVENFDLTGIHYLWIDDPLIADVERPEWALTIETRELGRYYGEPVAALLDGEVQTEDPAVAWRFFLDHHGASTERFLERRRMEKDDTGVVHRALEGARLHLRQVELDHGPDSEAAGQARAEFEREQAAADEGFAEIRGRIRALNEENERYQLVVETADGQRATMALAEIVRAYPANQLGLLAKLETYASRWWEFLWDEPRASNLEGGVFPALFGTVIMTLIMTVIVVPFGVLAALYLREYAKQGVLIGIIRIAVNNLAGVPSIVFGVFGLGFFCYIVGGGIDGLFFEARLPSPTYGKGGILWASLTLALLTLPVVIVATEEALAAVPSSMREGSYACGATKWQTIRRIVLPRAAPGIMTGAILAIARGAGEVAPLMLVGAAKLAPDLPLDGVAPFIHPERSFMHLGYHLFDLGFHSPNSEAAKPMVYTTTLLLIGIVVTLNLLAIWVRARLRKRYQGAFV
jgi:phosphate transport system permease protein